MKQLITLAVVAMLSAAAPVHSSEVTVKSGKTEISPTKWTCWSHEGRIYCGWKSKF
ncbi:MAG: hypothetical protein KKE94_16965 [Gammaproteobacteria bacterium]|nr:hypothetical protein [Gammaproteobacteria bacterium]